MTFTATATYLPIHALAPITFGDCKADTLDEAVSILMDDIREFMRREESNDWWHDITITVHHDSTVKYYPFQYWAKHFAWSY
jgi:hypothetical protein